MNQQKQNQLFMFKRIPAEDEYDYDKFELHKRIVVKDMPDFNRVCMQFHFKKDNNNVLIFTKMEEIFELDINTEQITTIYKFNPKLVLQPEHFEMDRDQNVFVVASSKDGYWW